MIKNLFRSIFNYFYQALVIHLDDDGQWSTNKEFLKQESALYEAKEIINSKLTA